MKRTLFTIIALLLAGYTFAQTDTSGRSLYRATPEKKTALKHTKLKVSFNFNNQTLSGEEWLTAAPYFYATDSLILDAKAMIIHKVALDQNGKQRGLSYSYKNDLLKIKLNKTYQKDEAYTIYIRYTAQPEKVTEKGSEAITDAKGLYFINPKGEPDKPMRQVWTQGETEGSSCWFPTIDKPNQKTTQEIEITVPESFVTLSNGLLKSSDKKGNMRTDYWVMDKPHAPYLFFMGAGEFAVVKDTPWRGTVPIEYYVEKEYESVAKQIFGNTSEMITFFSERFGYDFPWSKYAQIVVREFVSGAMENTTAVSHAESAYQTAGALADQNYWEPIIAHELAHHWFGDLVTTESWSNLTVNESFANYSEYLWLMHKYGKDAAEYHLSNNTLQYQHRPNDFVKDLVRFGYDSREDMFDLVSYNKGGAILHMLRNYLGDAAFFAGLTDYLKTNEYGTGEAHQLRLSLEKVSGKDLNWFFNQWYFGNGNPVVNVEKSFSRGKLTLKVIQTQSEDLLFQFPLDIDLYINNRVKRHTVWVDARKENVFTFPIRKMPTLVDINPEGVILMNEQYQKSWAEYLFQMQHAKSLKSRLQAVSAPMEPDGKDILIAALKDPFFQVRVLALQKLANYDLNAKEMAMVEKIATSDPQNLAKSAAMWVLATSKDKKKYTPIFEKNLESTSGAIKNAAINGIARTEPARAKSILEKGSVKDFDTDQLAGLSGVIVDNQMEQYLPAILPYFIYYPFFEKDNPDTAANFKKGYEWAMHLDNTSHVELLAKSLKEIAKDMENPAAKEMLTNVLEEGITIKRGLNQTESVKKQIKMLEEIKGMFKS